jgi:hypothetical protein
MGQFTVNEFCHELVYRSVSEKTKRTISQNSPMRFGISLGSGLIAGVAAAILSHVIALFQPFFVCLVSSCISLQTPSSHK